MIKFFTLLLALFMSLCSVGQNHNLSIFDNLMGKEWHTEGNWGDGSLFLQKINFEYGLDSTVILVNTVGYIDEEQTKVGPRNYGLRKFDSKTNRVLFWEFDVFGGVTEGVVFNEEKNIFYQYQYGETMITEQWEYVDDFTYKLTIGNYKQGLWDQIYLKSQINGTLRD